MTVRSRRAGTGRRAAKGSSFVEATLVLVLFLGLLFLLMDLGWGLFAKATLQHAVRSGCRYAVTSQIMTVIDEATEKEMTLGQVDSIKQVVKRQAMGLLSDSDVNRYVFVRFYAPSAAGPVLVEGAGSNGAGNLVMVSVEGFPLTPLAPLLRLGTAVPITTRAGDVLEPQPTTGVPAL